MYCVDLLQFAFLHTFSVERVKGREALQNLAKLRGIYQIMKEKFYDKSVIHLPRQYLPFPYVRVHPPGHGCKTRHSGSV